MDGTGPSWPAVSYEERHWSPAEGTVSRRRRERLTGPYGSAVLAPVAAITPAISADTGALAEEATLEMVRFDAEASAVLGVLGEGELAPVASVLLRSESAASSQIEHLTAGARQLALAELGAPASTNAQTVSDNVRAMRAALDLAHDVDEAAILQMHRALMDRFSWAAPGAWRRDVVWIGGEGPPEAVFVPPSPERVPAAMADLVALAARRDIPVLAHAALVHAQFETIHPFIDGNGRTGRALIHSLLRGRGVTRRLTVPVSAGLLTDTSGYFAALTAFRVGDVEPIIIQLALAAEKASANGRVLLADLAAARESWRGTLRARRDAAVWRSLGVLLAQPVLDVTYLQRALGVTFPAAEHAMATMEAAGIVRASFVGRERNRVWHAPDVLDALDAFAERAGRRAG